MLSYAFYMLLYPFMHFLYALICFNMLLKAKVSQQEMMLALCITGFCFAESGKNLWNGTLNAMKSRAQAKLF